MQERNDKKTKEMAVKILKTVQQNIIKKYYVLTPLIISMELCPVAKDCILETDGKRIYYQPMQICLMAKKGLKELQKYYMHLIVHGLLFHFVDYRKYSILSLANAIMDLEVDSFISKLEKPMNCSMEFNDEGDRLQAFLNKKGAAGLYDEALHSKYVRQLVYTKAKRTAMDHHENWQVREYLISQKYNRNAKQEYNEICEFWTRMIHSCMMKTGLSINQMISQMNGQSKNHGTDSLNEELVVERSNKKPLDYITILRKFFHEKDVCREDLENFDRDLYALGREMYEDVALLEPMEESEQTSMGTIVLAIDTSGSCSGEIIEMFVTQTGGLIRTMSQMDYKELVVIQADASICSEEHFKPGDPLPECERMTMYGFGGTDFRPVFKRVEEINKKTPVDVLIYLSDGYGEFPQEKSKVKTFFVIPNMEQDENLLGNIVPDWVECLAI